MKDINIVDTIKSEFAVSPEDGDIIYSLIENYLTSDESISLNFDKIDIITTAFLNNAIGKLYKNFEKDKLNRLITMKNISNSDLALVKKVIERAKITFTDEDIKNIEEELGDE